jgi:hypothetical protein
VAVLSEGLHEFDVFSQFRLGASQHGLLPVQYLIDVLVPGLVVVSGGVVLVVRGWSVVSGWISASRGVCCACMLRVASSAFHPSVD